MQVRRKLTLRLLTCATVLMIHGNTGIARMDASSTYKNRPVNYTQEHSAVTEFRTYMLQAISTFSMSRQCTILMAILKESGESLPPALTKHVYEIYPQLPCLKETTTTKTTVNTSELRRTTNYYVTSLFNSLPLAYQCKILLDVSRATRGRTTKRFRTPPGPMDFTSTTLQRELRVMDISRKCNDPGPRKPIMKTLVRLVVRLRKFLPLDVWLTRFKKVLPSLYLRYVSKMGRISELVTKWKQNEDGARVPLIPADQFLVKFQGKPFTDDSVAIVIFSLFSRTPAGDYKVTNSDDIVKAFEDIQRSTLNSYLEAKVIGWVSYVEDGLQRVQRMRNKEGKPSRAEIVRLQSLFPKYLLKFFKSLARDGRCYILRQISSYVGQDLLQVEKSYHSLNLLPKKYYCSRVHRYGSKTKRPEPRLPNVWDHLDRLTKTISPSVTTPIFVTAAEPQEPRNSTIIRQTRPLNSMEVVMFVLLGFLCLLIMVFVANCVVFTFKTKQLNTKYATEHFQQPQFVFGDVDYFKSAEYSQEDNAAAKLSLLENPQSPLSHEEQYETERHSVSDRETSVFADEMPTTEKSTTNANWRLMSAPSDGGTTLCDDISLSEGEPERVSSV